MSQLSQLIIYEPRKEPRTVHLNINPSDFENISNPVFNEDGSLLKNYRTVSETFDVEPAAPQKHSMENVGRPMLNAGDAAKLKANNLVSGTVPNDRVAALNGINIELSDTVQNFLSQVEVNSSRKEKKIARVKIIKENVAAIKLKNKLKKQRRKLRKKMAKQLFSGERFDSFVNSRIDGEKKESFTPRDDERNHQRWENDQAVKIDHAVSIGKSSKAKKGKKKKKNKARAVENGIQCGSSEGMNNHAISIEKTPKCKKRKKKKKKACGVEVSRTTESSNSHSEKPNVTTWNANESAPDYIPINTGSSSSYSKSSLRDRPMNGRCHYSHTSQSSEQFLTGNDEFLGISQKAFFLQC